MKTYSNTAEQGRYICCANSVNPGRVLITNSHSPNNVADDHQLNNSVYEANLLAFYVNNLSCIILTKGLHHRLTYHTTISHFELVIGDKYFMKAKI